MAWMPDELLIELDHQLDQLGLSITGDDEAGFTIRCGTADLRTPRGIRFDSAAEATAVALTGLLDRVRDLADAAAAVVRSWEHGDLAAAVRELDVCTRAVVAHQAGSTPHQPHGGSH